MHGLYVGGGEMKDTEGVACEGRVHVREWIICACKGVHVASAERPEQQVYCDPLRQSLVWFQSPDSSAGKLRLILIQPSLV